MLSSSSLTLNVIRRVGGLEVSKWKRPAIPSVIRRVGGLEDYHWDGQLYLNVIRRVGGLEGE